jgi:hypothetical protein
MLAKLRPDFAPEWIGLLAIAALDLAWARIIGFHLILAWHDFMLLALALAVTAGLSLAATRRPFLHRGAVMGEYFSLTLAATSVFAVLSYLCLASSGALVDADLLAADRALGFDWLAGYHFLKAHPLPTAILKFAYDSLVYQGLYFCVLLALMGRRREMREMFWLVLVAGLFTSAGAALFPALGPFKAFHAAPAGSFLPEMEQIKGGHLTFALAHLTGVVSFPSFHTSMALAYAWGFRRTGFIGWTISALNLLMLCAIPWFGGHYLADMIAGAAVMLAALAIVKAAPRLSMAPARAAGTASAYSFHA